MKERPILFSGEMVRAILDGRKTMTRRVIKYPYIEIREDSILASYCHDPGTESPSGLCYKISCPHGQPGDLLWVRETFCQLSRKDIRYRANGEEPLCWKPSIFMPRWASRLTLEITAVRVERVQDISEEDAKAEGIAGPVDVGYPAYRMPGDSKARYSRPAAAFEDYWDSLNAKRGFGWELNPFVWAISFKRICP